MSDKTLYRIPAGKHTCTRRFPWPVLWRTYMEYECTFDASAQYTTMLEGNQADVNKLFGFTEGWRPHKNSARIGWNYIPKTDASDVERVQLWAYTYSQGVRHIEFLGAYPIGEKIRCRIELRGGGYRCTAATEQQWEVQTMPRAKRAKYIFGFRLFPYFGGDEPAPHEVRIKLLRRHS